MLKWAEWKKALVALKNIDILFMNNLFWNTLIFGFMSARRAYIHTYASYVEKENVRARDDDTHARKRERKNKSSTYISKLEGWK